MGDKMLKKVIILLLISIPLMAQSFAVSETIYGNNHEWVYYVSSVDSGSTSGSIIELNRYDGNLASYPMGYYLDIDTLTANDEIIAIYIQGKFAGGNWVNVDTLLASDTLNANHAGYEDIKGETDFGAANWVFPQYRPLIVISSSSDNTCAVRLGLYAYKED